MGRERSALLMVKEEREHRILYVELYSRWHRWFKIHVPHTVYHYCALLCVPLPSTVTHNHADIYYTALLGCKCTGGSLYVALPGPCWVVLAMIHLTRQHFIRDLRVILGFCHLEPSVCPPGFGSFPLASGIRPPSTALSFAWGRQKKFHLLWYISTLKIYYQRILLTREKYLTQVQSILGQGLPLLRSVFFIFGSFTFTWFTFSWALFLEATVFNAKALMCSQPDRNQRQIKSITSWWINTDHLEANDPDTSLSCC